MHTLYTRTRVLMLVATIFLKYTRTRAPKCAPSLMGTHARSYCTGPQIRSHSSFIEAYLHIHIPSVSHLGKLTKTSKQGAVRKYPVNCASKKIHERTFCELNISSLSAKLHFSHSSLSKQAYSLTSAPNICWPQFLARGFALSKGC